MGRDLAPEDRPPCRGDPSLKDSATLQVAERSESPNVARTRRNGLSKSPIETNASGGWQLKMLSAFAEMYARRPEGANAYRGSETRELASTQRLTTESILELAEGVMFRSVDRAGPVFVTAVRAGRFRGRSSTAGTTRNARRLASLRKSRERTRSDSSARLVTGSRLPIRNPELGILRLRAGRVEARCSAAGRFAIFRTPFPGTLPQSGPC